LLRALLRNRTRRIAFIAIALLPISATSQTQATLNFTLPQTSIDWTLGDVLHTVNGQFSLKSGVVHFDPGSNAVSGLIVVDATSGNSGNGSRDHKMHREVLESDRYPEITFRPDRVAGKVLAQGTSNVEVHGMFDIHGGAHELSVPAQVELEPDHWTLTVHFDVPYVKWGLKDPSTFILKVEKTVAINLHASGPTPWTNPR